jgi:hypothetical protein
MADLRACDLCGKAPANRVEVGLVLWAVVEPEQPTATSEALDACEAHQENAADALHAHAKETLREQIPFHIRMIAVSRKRDGFQEEFNTAVKPLLEAFAANHADPPADLVTRRDGLLQSIHEAEQERLSIAVIATGLSDARVKAMRAAVKLA